MGHSRVPPLHPNSPPTAASDLKAAGVHGCPPATVKASFGGCWGPGPVQRRSSNCFPLAFAVSRLSPLSSWGLRETKERVRGSGASRLALCSPSIPLTFPQVKLGPWEWWARWESPAGPGSELGLPPASAGEWKGRCPQGTWAWGGGSGLRSWERGQLSALGASQGHRQSQAPQPKPRPRSVPTRAGKAGGQGGSGGNGWAAGR